MNSKDAPTTETGARVTVDLVSRPEHPDAVATFEKLAARQMNIGIKVANIHRTIANSPTLFANFVNLADSLRNETTIDPAEREMAILCVLERHGGDYELVPHRLLGRKLGLTEPQLAHVSSPETPGVYSDRQRAILRFAQRFAADPDARREYEDDAIESYLDNRQRIELALNMAIYMGLAHFTSVLDVPAEAALIQPPLVSE